MIGFDDRESSQPKVCATAIEKRNMKREESILNLLCVVAAVGFFALIAYNLLAGGSIISTDGLFFIVVPLVLALSFLAVPGMGFLLRMLERRATAGGAAAPARLAPAGGGHSTSPNVPALKDTKGRAMPPDVSRMVAQMKAGKDKE
jgi:hypothetical protein